MDRHKIKERIESMVDDVIEEVLSERKSEFDVMKVGVKKDKKSMQKEKKVIIDLMKYEVNGVKLIDVTPEKPLKEKFDTK